MKSISLHHIKRVGLVEWRNREWWNRQTVRIWSQEHSAWWRPDAHGYTDDETQAWAIDFPTAYEHTKHCGPEKRINYFTLPIAKKPADPAPYATLEEAEAEEIARLIWIGWDNEWTDLVGEIQAAARRLHAMGYRRTPAVSQASREGET